jgi:hypothetical protein
VRIQYGAVGFCTISVYLRRAGCPSAGPPRRRRRAEPRAGMLRVLCPAPSGEIRHAKSLAPVSVSASRRRHRISAHPPPARSVCPRLAPASCMHAARLVPRLRSGCSSCLDMQPATAALLVLQLSHGKSPWQVPASSASSSLRVERGQAVPIDRTAPIITALRHRRPPPHTTAPIIAAS